MSTIFQLSQLISQSVNHLESQGAHLPSLNELWSPNSEAFRSTPGTPEAINTIVAAAYQLIATLLPGPVVLSEFANAHIKSATLRIALESNTAEILREAGPKGLHAEQIALKSGGDAGKIARILRFLATHHIFSEVSPDVFANNRLSSVLDTGKSHVELVNAPNEKYDNTSGLTALLGHNVDECHKTSGFAWEAFKDEATPSAYSLAYQTKLPMFESLEQPGNEQRLKRFGTAMTGVSKMFPPDIIKSLFNWQSLPPRSVVVDVGGGVGTSCMPLATGFPDLKLVVQDRGLTVQQGRELWESSLPDDIASGRVRFQEHDFFTPQPIKNAAVFFLKHVLHNWSDPDNARILTELRRAATPETCLLVIDSIMPYASRSDEDAAWISSTSTVAPLPLLPNFGGASGAQYTMDIQMMLLLSNAQERTIHEFERLLESAGWRIVYLRRSAGEELHSVEAVPI